MKAGKLRHRVRIERPYEAKVDGVQTTTWALFAETWASIEMMKPYDRANAQAIFPGADVTIGMRYRSGVTGEMRVVHDDTIYAILGPPNDIEGRNREMILTCQTGVKTS